MLQTMNPRSENENVENNSLVQELIAIHNRKPKEEEPEPVTGGLFE